MKVPPPPRSMKSIISPLKVSALPKKRNEKNGIKIEKKQFYGLKIKMKRKNFQKIV